MMIKRILWIVGGLLITASTALAADLGTRFDSFEGMHSTAFGSLFFVEGVAHDWDIASQPHFVIIQGDGRVSLPVQSGGYCFAFNHYTATPNPAVSRTYRALIGKTLLNGRRTRENFSGEYIPTPDVTSSAVPTLCINGIAGISAIALQFGSEGTSSFNRTISFELITPARR